MGKLRLTIDALRVESFAPAADPRARTGTVRGQATEPVLNSQCAGTGCGSEGLEFCGGTGLTEWTCDCTTYTQGNDDTCINCTRQLATCTENPDFCDVVSQGTCFTQQACC